jgi:hypothetical protein
MRGLLAVSLVVSMSFETVYLHGTRGVEFLSTTARKRHTMTQDGLRHQTHPYTETAALCTFYFHPDAPTIDYPAPAGPHVPRVQQRPMTIQFPSPTRAKVRAAQLATAMTPPGGVRGAMVSVGTPDARLAAG